MVEVVSFLVGNLFCCLVLVMFKVCCLKFKKLRLNNDLMVLFIFFSSFENLFDVWLGINILRWIINDLNCVICMGLSWMSFVCVSFLLMSFELNWFYWLFILELCLWMLFVVGLINFCKLLNELVKRILKLELMLEVLGKRSGVCFVFWCWEV